MVNGKLRQKVKSSVTPLAIENDFAAESLLLEQRIVDSEQRIALVREVIHYSLLTIRCSDRESLSSAAFFFGNGITANFTFCLLPSSALAIYH